MDEELEQPVLSFLNGEEGWNDEYSSISEFKHHLKEDILADHERLKYRWVLWRQNEQQLNNTTHLQYKIITLFKHLSSSFECICFNMAQFWGVVKVEGRRHYLSTSHHPFSVSDLRKGYCWYRKQCMDHVYCVEVDGTVEEAQLGGVGRAYRNKHPESTPDLRLYSTNEFPLCDHAARCGFRFYLALPLFDLHTNECCGVLELLSHRAGMNTNLISSLTEQLQIAGLRSTHIKFNRISCDKNIMVANGRDYGEHARFPATWTRLNNTSTAASATTSPTTYFNMQHQHSDYMVSAGVAAAPPLSGSSEMSAMVTALTHVVSSELQNEYIRGGGIASSSANLIQASINSPSSAYSSSSSGSVGRKRRHPHHHQDCATDFSDNVQRVYREFGDSFSAVNSGQRDDVPIKFRSVQYCQMEHQQAEEAVQYVSKKTQKGKRKTGFHLSLEDLKPHFGKKLKDVAEELGVGRSTIKRACRYHNIGRWPYNEKQTRNPSLYETETEQDSQQDVQPSSSGNVGILDVSLHQNGPCTNTESLIVEEEEVEKVIMKVRFGQDIVKFELLLSLGVGKLLEEVATRLNLKMGTFKLKYLDEDKDEILVTCDADLQLCPKTQTATSKNCIQLFVQLVS